MSSYQEAWQPGYHVEFTLQGKIVETGKDACLVSDDGFVLMPAPIFEEADFTILEKPEPPKPDVEVVLSAELAAELLEEWVNRSNRTHAEDQMFMRLYLAMYPL